MAQPPVSSQSQEQRVQEFVSSYQALRAEVGKIIVGHNDVVSQVLVGLFAGGHVLLEGVPGLGKTLLIKTLAESLELSFSRIQFTPDLMPGDIIGTNIIVEDSQGRKHFQFQRGPIFGHILLADEVNRATPKTQSALLEGMQEGSVTVSGHSHPLPSPFFVLATQNPIEMEGTYPLPEAQLDRFLMKIVIDYPGYDDEWKVIENTTGTRRSFVTPVLSRYDVSALQRVARSLPVSAHIVEYATSLARASRPDASRPDAPRPDAPRPDASPAPAWTRSLVAWGAGPRAAQALILAAKARTLLEGRFAVTRADVRRVAPPVLRHRILPSFEAEGSGVSADEIVARLLAEVPTASTRSRYDAVTQELLRL
jgi:MoxR-like ATPase